MIDRYNICTVGQMYKEDCGEWVRYDEAQKRIAELEAALVTARENTLQRAANACCHPQIADHDSGEAGLCRSRVLALKATP